MRVRVFLTAVAAVVILSAFSVLGTDVVQCLWLSGLPSSHENCEALTVRFDGMVVKSAVLVLDSESYQRVFRVEYDGIEESVFGVVTILGSPDDDTFITRRDSTQAYYLPITAHMFDGNDCVEGTPRTDWIDGAPGSDSLFGQGGADTIRAGLGPDFVSGGNGDDVIDGEKGADIVSGDDGRDTVSGGEYRDLILGGRTKITTCAEAVSYSVSIMLQEWKTAAIVGSPTLQVVVNEMLSAGGLLEVGLVALDDGEPDVLQDTHGTGLTVRGESDLVSGSHLVCTFDDLCAPLLPTTSAPTDAPTSPPTAAPLELTAAPTSMPTGAPTALPTSQPSTQPTSTPTALPSMQPTESPSAPPTAAPIEFPTQAPSSAPTQAPQINATTLLSNLYASST